jgi:LAGLIDADG DNA endonuclease family protein
MNEVEAAWLAGLYEGEGCLVRSFDKRSDHVSWAMTITMTDQDVIEKIVRITGLGGCLFTKRQQPNWSDKWRWRIGATSDVKEVVETILPHLGERRRARCEEFLAWHAQRTHVSRKRTRNADSA